MEETKLKKQIVIVKGLVIDENSRVLLIRRKMEHQKDAHNKWEFPGGKIEFGETPEAACIREIKEESGYDASVDFLLPKVLSSTWKFLDRESHLILICYACTLKGGTKSLSDHGVSEINWFNSSNPPPDSECLPGTIEFLNVFLKK